jgi:hypothetical protein
MIGEERKKNVASIHDAKVIQRVWHEKVNWIACKQNQQNAVIETLAKNHYARWSQICACILSDFYS